MTAMDSKMDPKHAVLELTFRCNPNCIFCYLPWLEEPSMIAPELMLTYEELRGLGRRVEKLKGRIKTPLYFSDEYFCSCRGECIKPKGLPEGYSPPPCHIENRTLVVGPAGQCRKCLHTFDSLGDVRELYP